MNVTNSSVITSKKYCHRVLPSKDWQPDAVVEWFPGATRFGVTLFTVRMHLSRIFEKTDSRRQAELVRLLMRDAADDLTPPAAAG